MQAVRDHSGQVGGQTATSDVAVRVHLRGTGERQAVQRVDLGGLQQLLAQGAAELLDLRVQGETGLVQQDVADQ